MPLTPNASIIKAIFSVLRFGFSSSCAGAEGSLLVPFGSVLVDSFSGEAISLFIAMSGVEGIAHCSVEGFGPAKASPSVPAGVDRSWGALSSFKGTMVYQIVVMKVTDGRCRLKGESIFCGLYTSLTRDALRSILGMAQPLENSRSRGHMMCFGI